MNTSIAQSANRFSGKIASPFQRAANSRNISPNIFDRSNSTMRSFLFLLASFLFSTSLLAQSFQVSGRVADKVTNEPIIGANIGLYRMPDSVLVTGGQSDVNGNFLIPNVPKGMYRAQITFVGYAATRFPIRMNADVDFGTKQMESTAKNLKGVEIEGAQTRASQKGDTTEINADAFKVNPDATAEDLVKKMPGITVDNGVVKSGGEEVKKVLIDGKEFFGDDASMALRNLPAEVVSKIQVFDKLSDQAQFSGFDDGNSRRTMNVVTRRGMKNAQFGKIYAGGGTEGRYAAGMNLNFFDGNRRISILGQSNNINQQNFSSQDLLGVTSGGGGGGMGGGGMGRMMGMAPGANDPSNFMVGQSNGINTTHALGLNYSDSLSPKVKLSGSYFFNNTLNETSKSVDRDFYLDDTTTQRYSETNSGWSNNINHRMNMRIEINLDTNNSIIYTPRVSWQANQNASNVVGNTVRNSISSISSTATSNTALSSGYSMGHNILLRHKMKKSGRTVSLTLNSDNNEKNGESGLGSTNIFSSNLDTVSLNQKATNYSNGQTYSTNVMFTEPLGKMGQLFLTYAPSLSLNTSSKETNRFNAVTGEYTALDSLLSNRYENTITTQRGGAGVRIRTPKFMMVLNANAQQLILDGSQLFPNSFGIRRTFNNILPFAMLNYKFSSSTNIRVFYRSNTNTPSISQLQSVVDNSNPLQLSTGNRDLNQEFSQTLTTRFGSANVKTSRAFFANISSTLTNNYIGNSTILANSDTTLADGIKLRKGSQLSRPVNLNGFMNLNSLLTYSLPVKWIKSTLNLQGGLSYSLKPGEVNGLRNETSTYTYTGGVVVASNISEKIDFTLTYNGGWNDVMNSLQPSLNNNYVVQNAGLKANWLPWKGLVLNTELTHSRYDGLGTGFNQKFTLWNAGIGYKFLKAKSGEIRATAFDLLNQNRSISRTVTETYVEDNSTKVLNRYFMFTFTYTFRKFNGMKMPEAQPDPHGPGNPHGAPMGPPPGGR
jgi:hypothetical protein